MNRNFLVSDLNSLSKTGIYKITCLSNNKIYIGSACCTKAPPSKKGFYGRWSAHINKLRDNNHRNKHLQYSWNKYGENNFTFEIVEFCSKDTIQIKEDYWIKFTNCTDQEVGFNFLKNHLANYRTMSEKCRKILSDLYTGKKRDKRIFRNILKPVLQYTKDGIFIKEYYGVSEAFRQTGIQRQDIGKVCNGKLKSAGGFVWKFKIDNDIV